jgi:hypothetical protein
MGPDWSDQDLGASGIVLIEELGIGLVSGKDGVLYTIRLDQPGNTKPVDLQSDAVAGNYEKLATAPILYTFFDPAVDPASKQPTALNVYSGDRTHHLHGTPVAWKGSGGWVHFCGGENGNLRAWQMKPDLASLYLACSEAYASPESRVPLGGMPGWSIALSANGSRDGVIWAMIPYDDANAKITNSRLIAYDAQDFAKFANGEQEITALWDSQQWAWNFLHPKFNRPIAVDGKVIVPTYGGEVLVLALS